MVTEELRYAITNSEPDAAVQVIIKLPNLVRMDSSGDGRRSRPAPRIAGQLRQSARADQAPLLEWLRHNGASRIRQLWINNSIAATVRADLVDQLADYPGVEGVQLDFPIKLAEPESYGDAPAVDNLVRIKAPNLWDRGFTGAGIVIAAMDTGADLAHPELIGKWRGGTNSWYDPNEEHAEPYDADGHGTQVLGVILGGSLGGSIIGVAPEARWIAAKVFDDQGKSSLSALHLGFQWFLDPDGNAETDDAPHVVNCSWAIQGSVNKCSLEFADDLRALRAAGIAVVWAAGNNGPYASTSYSPANGPGGFAVGSAGSATTPTLTSSRGPSACTRGIYPSVLAPGVGIRTCDLTFGGVIPNSYVSVSGSSFAAAHVSGALALLTQAIPCASPRAIEYALEQTALNSATPDNNSGYGLIDLEQALLWLQEPSHCSAPSTTPARPPISGRPASIGRRAASPHRR